MPVTIVLGFLQSVASLTKENTREEPETSAEAVDALIEAGQEEGIIQAGDRDLIQSVVEFSGKTVREAMKPRPAMFALTTDTTVEQLIEKLRIKHYARVPVYEGSIHNIKGIVYAQDVLQVPDSEAKIRTLDSIMRRDVHFVPESKLGSDLLREMQKDNIRMAIVVDEFGSTAGLITVEDILEQLVGEIEDEFDVAAIEGAQAGSKTLLLDGTVGLRDLESQYDLLLPRDAGFETLAGFLLSRLQKIPAIGDACYYGARSFTVEEMDGHRISKVKVRLKVGSGE